MKLSPEELTAMVRYQVGALKAFLDAEDVPLHHVKVRPSVMKKSVGADGPSLTVCYTA